MLDNLDRVLGIMDGDWDFRRQASDQRREEGRGELQKGDMTGFLKARYARVLFPERGWGS